MSWFTVPEKLLFCETCKAHIEEATYTGTVLEEAAAYRGSSKGTGYYAVKRLAFCARCKPAHDIVIIRRDQYEHIHVDTVARALVDPASKEAAARITVDAVVEAVREALEAASAEREPAPGLDVGNTILDVGDDAQAATQGADTPTLRSPIP